MSMFGVDYLMSELYRNELKIDLKELFTIFKSKHDYDVFCEYITNYIMDDYTRANNVVTIYDENNNIINISLFQLLINLYLLEFNFMYKVPVTRDWLLDIDKRFFQDYHKHIEQHFRQPQRLGKRLSFLSGPEFPERNNHLQEQPLWRHHQYYRYLQAVACQQADGQLREQLVHFGLENV